MRVGEGVHELTIGQLAERSGVAVSALRFYESKGLIRSRRTSGNQRRYPRDTLRRVAFIRVSQRVGIPLSTIREALANLPDERTPTRRDWRHLSESWRSELDSRIEQLVRLRDTLTECIGCGCLSLGPCKLVNPGDQLGGDGAGPRTLLIESPDKADCSPSACAAEPDAVEKAAGKAGERTADPADEVQGACGVAR